MTTVMTKKHDSSNDVRGECGSRQSKTVFDGNTLTY
jgi:hypothetical protein